MSKIILYQTANDETQVEVRFEGDTVWLSQTQLVELYRSSKANISEHIKHIFKENELSSESTVQKFRTVRIEGKRNVEREIEHYNLDMIISLGYRIKSSVATQFRIWATQRLKEHFIQGYSINQKRLDELQQTVQLIQKSISTGTNLSETKGLLEIITQYTQSFVLLNQFDSDSIQSGNLNEEITYEIDYSEAKNAISELKKTTHCQKRSNRIIW